MFSVVEDGRWAVKHKDGEDEYFLLERNLKKAEWFKTLAEAIAVAEDLTLGSARARVLEIKSSPQRIAKRIICGDDEYIAIKGGNYVRKRCGRGGMLIGSDVVLFNSDREADKALVKLKADKIARSDWDDSFVLYVTV
jgi:hypothetical protein